LSTLYRKADKSKSIDVTQIREMLSFSVTSLYTCILLSYYNIGCVDSVVGRHDEQAGRYRLVSPAGRSSTATEQSTQQQDTLSVESDDDAESDGQEQGPMRDKLQETRKTPNNELMEGVIQTGSVEKHASTMSNSQNGESSKRGPKRWSEEVSAGSRDNLYLQREEHYLSPGREF